MTCVDCEKLKAERDEQRGRAERAEAAAAKHTAEGPSCECRHPAEAHRNDTGYGRPHERRCYRCTLCACADYNLSARRQLDVDVTRQIERSVADAFKADAIKAAVAEAREDERRKERERCLAWVEWCWREGTASGTEDGIRSGAPAPGGSK